MYLIVGLGNPGTEYEQTRHNIGFVMADALRDAYDLPAFRLQKKFRAETTRGMIADHPVVLAKPQTFMNESGASVGALKSFFRIPVTHCLVIYDDKDLPLGTVRMRGSGGSGGHNGMKSVLEHLKNPNVLRIRVGISPSRPIGDTSDFVLSTLTKKENQVLSDVQKRVVEGVRLLLTGSREEAMTFLNTAKKE
ncbi:MAG: aminoacyl-tRNA hydrolase [Candidatus Kerfeldbacteria bacterium]|nr:aminoacyl-tRNA hydrolase [Candidatus Kerfeldbacteria bacterium]